MFISNCCLVYIKNMIVFVCEKIIIKILCMEIATGGKEQQLYLFNIFSSLWRTSDKYDDSIVFFQFVFLVSFLLTWILTKYNHVIILIYSLRVVNCSPLNVESNSHHIWSLSFLCDEGMVLSCSRFIYTALVYIRFSF